MARRGVSLEEIMARVLVILRADETITSAVGNKVLEAPIAEIQPAQMPCAAVYIKNESGTRAGNTPLAPHFNTRFEIFVSLHLKGSTAAVVADRAHLIDRVVTVILEDATLGRLIHLWESYNRSVAYSDTERSTLTCEASCLIVGSGFVRFGPVS